MGVQFKSSPARDESTRCFSSELVLNKHTAISEAVVLRRIDQGNTERTLAFVTPVEAASSDALRTKLAAVLTSLNIDDIVLLSTIPRDSSGHVDEKRLTTFEVIDSALIDRWHERLRNEDSIAQVVVERTPRRGTGRLLHRLDLTRGLPAAQPSSVERWASDTDCRSTGGDGRGGVSKVPAIVHGAVRDLTADHPDTLGGLLRLAAEHHADHDIRYIDANGNETPQSYAELLSDARAVQAGLAELGLRPGDKVLFQLADNIDYLAGFWGAILGGLVPVPVSIALSYTATNPTVQKLISAWRTLDRPLILASDNLMAALRAVLDTAGATDARLHSISDTRAAPLHEQPDPAPDDLCLLLLTSGSTGLPKAVMHNHRTLLNRSASAVSFNRFDSSDVSLNWMPLDHVGGIVMFHLRDVFAGCRQIQVATDWILEDPLRWLDLIDRERATITWAPNFAYALVTDKIEKTAQPLSWDLSSMRFILNGGEAIVAKTVRRFMNHLAPHKLPATAMKPAWGMSETASGIVYSHDFLAETTSDSDSAVEVGEPIPNVSVRIVDADNRLVDEEIAGRLQVCGPCITPGYYNNPEQNQRAYTADGWFDTGDVGFLKSGRLTLTGRAKDEIIVNGINYPAAEIEAVVDTVDGVEVSFSAACGVRRLNSNTDELAIFFSPAREGDDDLADTLVAVRKQVSMGVGIRPTYLVPLQKNEIPKTAIGKIQRAQLKAGFESGKFDPQLKRADLLTNNNTLPDWFHDKVWRRREPVLLEEQVAVESALIFIDKEGLGEDLRAQLSQSGSKCFTVEAGAAFQQLDEYRYRIDPANAEHYHQLLEAVGRTCHDISDIIHLWTYSSDTLPIDSLDELKSAQNLGTYSILFITQALARARTTERAVRLTVVASGAQFVTAADRCHCQNSTVIGLLKTIPHELSWLKCCHLDLQPDTNAENVTRILGELRMVTNDDEIAYREGHRLTWALAPVDLAAVPQHGLLKQGGIYLITGGLGGIGAHVANVLTRHFQARLILVGRTSMPARDEWPACLEQGGHLAERIRRFEELEAVGGDIVYETADITDIDRLRDVISRAESRFGGRLAGIFHLAVGGDVASHWQNVDHHNVQRESLDSFEQMFHAKVFGTWNLYQLIEDRPEVILVNFSSVAGLFGAANFSAYAAANSFVDNFSLHQRFRRHRQSYSFDWSVWEDIGRSKSEPTFAKGLYRSAGFFPISKDIGTDCMFAGLSRDLPRLIVGLDERNWNIRRHMRGDPQPLEDVTAFLVASGGGTGTAWTGVRGVTDSFGVAGNCGFVRLPSLPLTDEGVVARDKLLALTDSCGETKPEDALPNSKIELEVAAVWSDVLGNKNIGVFDNFFELGGNSLNATQVVSRMRSLFGIKVNVRELFENPTVRQLAEIFEQRIGRIPAPAEVEVEGALDYQALLEKIDDLSEEQVNELIERMNGGPAG